MFFKQKNIILVILMTKKKFKERIENMMDIYGRRTINLKKVEIDESYPRAIRENIIKYKKWIA